MAEISASFFNRFSESLASFPEITPGCGILLCLSAGKDSMALFHMMNSIKTEKRFRLGVFHLNHCMRGKESDDDERFLAEICGANGIPFYPFRHQFVDTASFEEKAREKRYELSEQVRLSEGFDIIATAHTKNDTAETVLMRLFTGTHIRGLEGIPSSRGLIIRPMLWASSAEVYAFLKDNNLMWREDSSNNDDSYIRNFIRHRLIPLVETKFPQAVASVAECSAAALESRHLIEALLKHAGIEWRQHDRVSEITYHPLLQEDAVFNYIMAEMLRRSGQFVSGEKLSEMRKRFLSDKNRIVLYDSPECEIVSDLRPDCMRLYAENKTDCTNVPDDEMKKSPWSAEIIISGDDAVLTVESAPFLLKAEILHPEDVTAINFDFSDVLFLDVSCVDILRIRNSAHGDRILCGGGTKKLKKMMIDNKCTLAEKRQIPVIVSGDEIAAVGFGMIKRGMTRISDRFKVSAESKKVLALHRLYPKK